ncbi:MAG TPA: tRNA pseudouridine(55) synthase TruB [Candidatus Angelobacter sp.]|nr:tRNA pseudouridine(55) synthase TruB [Candidatus Angelobacter sp.]
MLGVVNLDKPVGPTSHDMVGLLRRLTGTRRIGHAGTLDPLASGVLPILVGGATRFSEELTGGRKRYDALIRLGARSATDDAEGPVTPSGASLPDREAIEEALRGFVGTIDQRPPSFSARKQGGRTAHRAARAGEPIELAPRAVVVEAIEVLDVIDEGVVRDVRIDLRCGPGTYVRSIARDLGDRLGCGGYLAALRRTEAAGLSVHAAVTPAHLEGLADDGRLHEAVLPVGDLLPLPKVTLHADAAWRFAHGSATPSDSPSQGRVAVFGDGALLGVGTIEDGQLRPDKVIPSGSDA